MSDAQHAFVRLAVSSDAIPSAGENASGLGTLVQSQSAVQAWSQHSATLVNVSGVDMMDLEASMDDVMRARALTPPMPAQPILARLGCLDFDMLRLGDEERIETVCAMFASRGLSHAFQIPATTLRGMALDDWSHTL